MSLSTEELIDMQNDDTFCLTTLNSIDEKKVSPVRFFYE